MILDRGSAPRTSTQRHMLGVRFGRLKDRLCRRNGHLPSETVSVGMIHGAYWRVCTRCGRGVETEPRLR